MLNTQKPSDVDERVDSTKAQIPPKVRVTATEVLETDSNKDTRNATQSNV